jgi:Na+-dependent transporters of the SNF family
MEMERKNVTFSGKLGYVLAAAGSAVGLGNIWRFPYLAAKQGGGIFILTYILLVILVGFFLALTETAIGRKTGKSTLDAFGALSKKWAWAGIIPAIVPVIILPYYSVVGGWIVKYLWAFITGKTAATTSPDYFGNFVSSPIEPIICFIIFFVFTGIIVSFGVEKGIENASRFMMPVLVLLCIGLGIYTMTMKGAAAGLKYLFVPNFSQLSINTVFAAMSQMFYSLSIAMGILITYGSYMKKDVAMDKAVAQVAAFDTGIAILAAIMVVPSVFVFSGGDIAALNKGAGLMFVTLPNVFNSFSGGTLVGALFFLLVLFAALTSAISLMEAVVNQIEGRTSFSRKKICILVTLYGVAVGSLVSLGFGPLDMIKIIGFSLFDFCDFISNSVLMPIGAIIICVFVGYVIKPKTLIDEINVSSKFQLHKVYGIILRYVAPVIIGLVFITSVMEGFGLIKY